MRLQLRSSLVKPAKKVIGKQRLTVLVNVSFPAPNIALQTSIEVCSDQKKDLRVLFSLRREPLKFSTYPLGSSTGFRRVRNRFVAGAVCVARSASGPDSVQELAMALSEMSIRHARITVIDDYPPVDSDGLTLNVTASGGRSGFCVTTGWASISPCPWVLPAN